MVVLTASDIGPNFSLEILEYKRKHHLQWLCGFNEKVRWNVNLSAWELHMGRQTKLTQEIKNVLVLAIYFRHLTDDVRKKL